MKQVQIPLPLITINQTGIVADVNVSTLNITHTYTGDLDMSLTSPTGTTIILKNDPCSSNDNILLGFDDEASTEIEIR